jgi:hypothetical protein
LHYRAGDVDGDGFDDFVFSLREFSLSEVDNDTLHHQVGALYRGGPGFINMTRPDFIVEPARTVYATAAGADIGFVVVLPPRTFAVGDVNGDGRPDFAQADIDSGSTHVFLGRPLTVPLANDAGATELFHHGLASPSGTTNPGPVGPVFIDGARPITGATSLAGRLPNEMLANSVSAGDVNGDGWEDFVLWGAGGNYLVFGPVRLNASGDVGDLATVLIDSGFGGPAEHQGDLNGDGLGDLVFVRNETLASPKAAHIWIFFGRPHGNWTSPILSPDRQFSLLLTLFAGADPLPMTCW